MAFDSGGAGVVVMRCIGVGWVCDDLVLLWVQLVCCFLDCVCYAFGCGVADCVWCC